MYRRNDNDKIERLASLMNSQISGGKLKDSAADWMREVWDSVSADGDLIEECIEAMAGGYGDPEDAIREIEGDVYTSDLYNWLSGETAQYMSEAARELGPFTEFEHQIMAAQHLEIEECGFALMSALNDVDEDDLEDDSEEEPVEAVYTDISPDMIANMPAFGAALRIFAAGDWREIERIELAQDRYIVYPVGLNLTVSGTAQDRWPMREHENYPEGL